MPPIIMENQQLRESDNAIEILTPSRNNTAQKHQTESRQQNNTAMKEKMNFIESLGDMLPEEKNTMLELMDTEEKPHSILPDDIATEQPSQPTIDHHEQQRLEEELVKSFNDEEENQIISDQQQDLPINVDPR